jgi:YebC/PmpR family DNA-binding regulatory protein
MLVDTATDNRNRTVNDIRYILSKHGGSLAAAGSVAYLFKPRGVIVVARAAADEERLIEIALEAGADDVLATADHFEVLTPPPALDGVRDAIAARGIEVSHAEQTKVASTQVRVDERQAEALLRLVDALEDHDDVQKVHANFDIPDEVLARLSR